MLDRSVFWGGICYNYTIARFLGILNAHVGSTCRVATTVVGAVARGRPCAQDGAWTAKNHHGFF